MRDTWELLVTVGLEVLSNFARRDSILEMVIHLDGKEKFAKDGKLTPRK